MSFNLAVIGCVFVLAGVHAGNKNVYMRFPNSKDPTRDIIKTVEVCGSERFGRLGTNDIIDTCWSNITGTVALEISELSSFLQVCNKVPVDGKKRTSVAFIAEVLQHDLPLNGLRTEKVENFDVNRWYRVDVGSYSSSSDGFIFTIFLTVYDRVVFYVPVTKFGEPIDSSQTIGVSVFREYLGTFYPKDLRIQQPNVTRDKKTTHANKTVMMQSNKFNYTEYCQLHEKIALQHDKGNTGQPNFHVGWEYYEFIGNLAVEGFRIQQIYE